MKVKKNVALYIRLTLFSEKRGLSLEERRKSKKIK